MPDDIFLLSITAASVGLLHTILGPDHYVPFIVMSKAGRWSRAKTFVVTLLCGIGHVLGSVALGLLGISLGLALNILETIESFRGDIAGWALVSFGLIYFIWGVKRAYNKKPHTHWHTHGVGDVHTHTHTHSGDHAHVHENENENEKVVNLTPWILFTIFVFGPCEALIPILIYPSATLSFSGMVIVIIIFSIATIGTMLTIVMLSIYGLSFLPLKSFERYTHAIAGFLIFFSGIAIQIFGL
jgi:ABC-type nickel/cobalt efflux system permease component RcnA